MKDPLATAASTIERHRMLEPGEAVLVAFSGGPDSTALAMLLAKLGYPIVLGHVDHGMRADSNADVTHCARLAERLARPFLYETVTVRPRTQAEARRERYAALERMRERSGASKIATGHSLDDQAETVRLRMERGGFPLGIPPVRDRIVRPVLDLRRAELQQVCFEAGVPYVDDPSNRDPKYARVRIRSELAGQPDEYVRRLAAQGYAAADDAREVARAAESAALRCVRAELGEVIIDRRRLSEIEPPVARRLVIQAAARAGTQLGRRGADDVLAKVVPVTGARLSLEGGLSIWSEKDEVVIGRWTPEQDLPDVPVTVPGVTYAPGWDLEIVAEPVPLMTPLTKSPSEELVDAGALGSELVLRRWRPGDRFQPLGSVGSKKLQDFFVDAGVARRRRGSVPLLVAGDRIVWVVGHRLDRRVRITDRSASAVRLRANPAPVRTAAAAEAVGA